MRFKQYENGSADLIFTDDERKIISEKGVIHLSDVALRQTGNHLVKIVGDWYEKFSDDVKMLHSHENEEIHTEQKK